MTNVKLFASRETIDSLSVTLMSVITLTDLLLGQGVNILTASLNQDPLELKQELVVLFIAMVIMNASYFMQHYVWDLRGPLETMNITPQRPSR